MIVLSDIRRPTDHSHQTFQLSQFMFCLGTRLFPATGLFPSTELYLIPNFTTSPHHMMSLLSLMPNHETEGETNGAAAHVATPSNFVMARRAPHSMAADVSGTADNMAWSSSREPHYIRNLDSTALKKKLEATSRAEPMTILVKARGTRIYCQVGYYELLKAALKFSHSSPDSLSVDHNTKIAETRNKDFAGNQVSTTYHVSLTTQGVRKYYTINLYHTTSTLLVNGRDASISMDSHLPILQTLMRKAGTHIPTLIPDDCSPRHPQSPWPPPLTLEPPSHNSKRKSCPMTKVEKFHRTI